MADFAVRNNVLANFDSHGVDNGNSVFKAIEYGCLEAIKKVFTKNKIEEFLFECKIKELKDNLLVFVEILDFVKKHDSSIFISVDDNQLIAFSKLLKMVDKHDIQITKESGLKKGSVEHRLSLIIDTMLNIERVRKMSK